MSKLTITQKRAKAALSVLTEEGTTHHFSAVWKKSSTWGYCPSISYRGAKAAYAGGCGYDKLSGVLAEYLSQLPDQKAANAVARLSGAGLNSVISTLAEHGWKLVHVYNGNSEDGFTIEKA